MILLLLQYYSTVLVQQPRITDPLDTYVPTKPCGAWFRCSALADDPIAGGSNDDYDCDYDCDLSHNNCNDDSNNINTINNNNSNKITRKKGVDPTPVRPTTEGFERAANRQTDTATVVGNFPKTITIVSSQWCPRLCRLFTTATRKRTSTRSTQTRTIFALRYASVINSWPPNCKHRSSAPRRQQKQQQKQ